MTEIYSTGFEEGYSYWVKNTSNFIGSYSTKNTSGQYVKAIDDAIQKLATDINSNGNNNPANFGFMAEYWHADTYNISAAVLRTNSKASALDSAEDKGILGGADIVTNDGQKIGLKYYKSGRESANAQSTTIKQRYMEYCSKHPNCSEAEYLEMHGLDANTDMNLPLYEGQARLIPSDQLKDAIESLQRKIDHDLAVGGKRAENVAALIETRDKLITHIDGPNGEKSLELTQAQAKQLQECARNGSFDPERYNITAAKLADRTFLLNNSINAGLDAALMSTLLRITPEVIGLLKKAIHDEYITADEIKNLGKNTVSSFGTGFVRGLLSSYITTSAELGYLGNAFKTAALKDSFPSTVAVVVTTLMEVSSKAIDLARNKISKSEFIYTVQRTMFIASAGYISGISLQAILHIAPGIGYLLGSMIGSIIGGLLFDIHEQVFMSLCVENGWTFFGVVEQDYTLPENVINRLGWHQLKYNQINSHPLNHHPLHYDGIKYNPIKYHQLDIIILERGVIGIRKVGYVTH